MKLRSLRYITAIASRTLKRFPLAIISAVIAVVLSIYLVERTFSEITQVYNIILVALLGIPFFTVSRLVCEKKGWNRSLQIGVHIGGIALLIIYFFTLPVDLDKAPYTAIYRHLLYIIGIHLLVAIAPYGHKDQIHAFWQYNKTLFLRFLTAVFFSGVLFAGLSIALLSIDVLLEISIDEKRYFQLFLLLGGIFNTWFFLAGIPTSLATFNRRIPYPKGLKVFTQNILIPLVIIYLLILYVYTGKIMVQWSWPEGWVANLILSFSIAGILALLLLYPIQEKVENRWIKRFSTAYFWALVPLVILLLMAIYRRIWEYGVTVERYFVIILGLWLAAIVVYFLFSKNKNIKVIPGSLCVLAFMISFGPWGAFSVSERSQINRLETYLMQNDLLKDESIQKASATVTFQDRKEISNIIRYLNNTHGLDGIQPWFAQDLDSLTTKAGKTDTTRPVSRYNRPEHVVELMGIEYESQGTSQPLNSTSYSRQFTTDQNNLVDVGGINELVQNLSWSPQETVTRRTVDDVRELIIRTDTTDNSIQLYFDETNPDTINIILSEIITELKILYTDDEYSIPAEDLTFDYSNGSLAVRVYIKLLSWKEEDGQIILQNMQFDVGLK